MNPYGAENSGQDHGGSVLFIGSFFGVHGTGSCLHVPNIRKKLKSEFWELSTLPFYCFVYASTSPTVSPVGRSRLHCASSDRQHDKD
jgi:hypothetical protein